MDVAVGAPATAATRGGTRSHLDALCIRCHKIEGKGGEVGNLRIIESQDFQSCNSGEGGNVSNGRKVQVERFQAGDSG